MGRLRIPADEVRVRFSRSGGPGGQNVNRRDTKVEVLFDPSASRALTASQRARVLRRLAQRLDAQGRLRVSASAERTQGANRARAIARLEALLAEAVRPDPPPRRATKPTAGATERRLTEKKTRASVKRLRRPPPRDDG